jgi:hypothetical protein
LHRAGPAHGDPRGGRAIGIEELRIDHVERLLGMQAPRQRQNRARSARVDPAGQARQQVKRGWCTGTPLRRSISGMARSGR